MSTLILEYEVLVSGLYPIEGSLKKQGFELVQKTVDETALAHLSEKGALYLSPLVGYCCYPGSNGNPVYLVFQKVETIEIDFGSSKAYDETITTRFLEALHLFDAVESLEKSMVLEINNDIKFPIALIKAYDPDGNLVTLLGDFKKLNIPSLLTSDQIQYSEKVKRQNNRLSSGISYDGIMKLSSQNNHFKNALAMYHSSFSVSDYKVGFILLITALEALVSLSTYAKVDQCKTCSQKLYKIRKSVSENVGIILMDQNNAICDRIKKLYDKRSNFLHKGIQDISVQEEQEIQEYVRKVLLMYWCVSMHKGVCLHKDIMGEIKAKDYKTHILYQDFLTMLDNTSYDEKKTKMIRDMFVRIL